MILHCRVYHIHSLISVMVLGKNVLINRFILLEKIYGDDNIEMKLLRRHASYYCILPIKIKLYPYMLKYVNILSHLLYEIDFLLYCLNNTGGIFKDLLNKPKYLNSVNIVNNQILKICAVTIELMSYQRWGAKCQHLNK